MVPAALVAAPVRGGDTHDQLQRERLGLVGMAHVCRPPGVQPPGTIWACDHRLGCGLEYQYGPVAVRELGGRVINLWVRIGRPFWTPYGNPAAAKQEESAT